MAAKTAVESSLRTRPTIFKGPKQLDVGLDDPDEHFNRMIHPLAWRKGGRERASGSDGAGADGAGGAAGGAWFKWKGDLPFVGFPNPNFFNMYTDAIPTQNLQDITHAQVVDALRVASVGDFDHNAYLDSIGSLLRSSAVPGGPASQSDDKVIQTDGVGVNADPQLL